MNAIALIFLPAVKKERQNVGMDVSLIISYIFF